MVDIGFIIAGINLVVGILILGMTLVTAHRLRGSTLSFAAWFFLATGVLFVLHAGIEVFGFGDELYSMTALVATLLLGGTVIVIGITARMLGVKS